MFTSLLRLPGPDETTRGNVARVLIAGFALVIVLLLAAGFIGIGNIRSIQTSAASLAEQQSVTNRLIDELKRQQSSLSEVFSVLARDPDSVDAASILAQLDEAGRQIDRIAEAGARTPAARTVAAAAERLRCTSPARPGACFRSRIPETFASRDLFRRHAEFIAVVARLIDSNYHKVIEAQAEIDQRSSRLLKESVLLLGACLVLALLSTALTVRLTSRWCAPWSGRRAS